MKFKFNPVCQGCVYFVSVAGLCLLLGAGQKEAEPPRGTQETSSRWELRGTRLDFRLNLFSSSELARMSEQRRFRFFSARRDQAGDLPVTDGLTIGQVITNYVPREWPLDRQVRLVRQNLILQSDALSGSADSLPGGGSMLQVKIQPGDVLILGPRE